MTQEFGEALERLRLGRGLSPAELARELDEYEGNVSRWRRGGGIDVVRVRKIADYFGVERGWLEGLAGYPPSATEGAKTVDADELAWNSYYHQMDPATRSTVVPMVQAAANASGDSTANRSNRRVNGRRKGHAPDIQSQKRGAILVFKLRDWLLPHNSGRVWNAATT